MKFQKLQPSKRMQELEAALIIYHQPQVLHKHRSTAIGLVFPDSTFVIGVSTCSPRDIFSKEIGRRDAYIRAYRAHMKKKTDGKLSHPVESPEAFKEIIAALKEAIVMTQEHLK